MDKKLCKSCVEYGRCRASSNSWFFVILGLVATISVRLVLVGSHIHPAAGKFFWYLGISGFFIFFIYRYYVSLSRARTIERMQLMDKLDNAKLSADDMGYLKALLCSLRSKTERINYFIIFVLSAVSIAVAVYLDFFV